MHALPKTIRSCQSLFDQNNMNIQGFQKLTLLDYPGKTACTVFTHGCNFRCPFCHNASLVTRKQDAQVTEDEFFAFLKKRRGVLDGVCVTGGEPLLQDDIAFFLGRIKEEGFDVKLDTNGSMPDKLSNLINSGVVDYIAMDIKTSLKNYQRVAGVDIDQSKIAESVKLIKSSTISHEFRTTAVKNLHTEDDFLSIAALISCDSSYFIQSYKDSGDVINTLCAAFSKEELEQILQNVKKLLPKASLRGIN